MYATLLRLFFFCSRLLCGKGSLSKPVMDSGENGRGAWRTPNGMLIYSIQQRQKYGQEKKKNRMCGGVVARMARQTVVYLRVYVALLHCSSSL